MAVHQNTYVALPVDCECLDPWETDDDGGRFRCFVALTRGAIVPVQVSNAALDNLRRLAQHRP